MIDHRNLNIGDLVVYCMDDTPGGFYQTHGKITQVLDDYAVMRDRDGHNWKINEATESHFFFMEIFLKRFKEELLTLIDEVTPARERPNREEEVHFEPLAITNLSDSDPRRRDYVEMFLPKDMFPVYPSCKPSSGMFFVPDAESAVGFSRVLAYAEDLASDVNQNDHARDASSLYIKKDAILTIIRPGTNGKNASFKTDGTGIIEIYKNTAKDGLGTPEQSLQEESRAAPDRRQKQLRRR